MRNNIVHIGADKLTYEIRWIIAIAEKLQLQWKKIIYENIWDPIQKWHLLPQWIKNIIKKHLENDEPYGYCPTKWIYNTRHFLADLNNNKWGVQISAEDILFFNGLWDAIATFYQYLRTEARIIGPSPAYSTHSSAEWAHAWLNHIIYDLDPNNNWQPNLEQLRKKIEYNDQIAWILILNPDNPTWAVYSKETIQKIVEIAKEFDLMLIADEIYHQTVYSGTKYYCLAELIWDCPWIAMKWISKEFPWPWSRCWWLEFYNTDKDDNFKRFVKSLNDAKMLEVCSTTLPQFVLPEIISDPRYQKYQDEKNIIFKDRAEQSFKIFSKIKWIKVNKTQWAFYFTVVFEKNIICDSKKVNVESKYLDIIKPELEKAIFDKRFVLYLLAKTWICTVPLSWFNTTLQWFRMTLLEKDDEKFTKICNLIKETVVEFLG